jgi:hypothetical protein
MCWICLRRRRWLSRIFSNLEAVFLDLDRSELGPLAIGVLLYGATASTQHTNRNSRRPTPEPQVHEKGAGTKGPDASEIRQAAVCEANHKRQLTNAITAAGCKREQKIYAASAPADLGFSLLTALFCDRCAIRLMLLFPSQQISQRVV